MHIAGPRTISTGTDALWEMGKIPFARAVLVSCRFRKKKVWEHARSTRSVPRRHPRRINTRTFCYWKNTSTRSRFISKGTITLFDTLYWHCSASFIRYHCALVKSCFAWSLIRATNHIAPFFVGQKKYVVFFCMWRLNLVEKSQNNWPLSQPLPKRVHEMISLLNK